MTTHGRGFFGSKYRVDLDVKEIAKLLRTDIAQAIKAGNLPAGKYSVTIDRYSGGQSIDVTVKACEYPIQTFDGQNGDRYTPTAKGTIEKLNEMLDAYRMDDSDSMTDYFHVNFYGHARFDWRLEAAERENRK